MSPSQRAGGVAILAVLLLAGACSASPTPVDDAGTAPTSAPAAPGDNARGTCPGKGRLESTEAPFAVDTPSEVIVYLPACYDNDPARRFPVAYLLHGANADDHQWPDIGVGTEADALIAAGVIGALIIVMPDGGPSVPERLATAVSDRLVPWADHAYRTDARPAGRVIGGISRGGRIALLAVAASPDTFAAVGAHSPAVDGRDPTPAIAAALRRPGLAVAVDIGVDDPLRHGVERFMAVLSAEGVPLGATVSPGGHDRVYWRRQVGGYLRFYDAHLAPSGAAGPPTITTTTTTS